MSRVPSGPQSSGPFRSGTARPCESIKSGTPMMWSEWRCVRNRFVTAFIGNPRPFSSKPETCDLMH